MANEAGRRVGRTSNLLSGFDDDGVTERIFDPDPRGAGEYILLPFRAIFPKRLIGGVLQQEAAKVRFRSEEPSKPMKPAPGSSRRF